MHAQSTTPETFARIPVAPLMDHLCAAVDAARVAAAGNQRWLNAIDAAWDHILAADVLEFDAESGALLYHSESGTTYTANGTCQCPAFKKGQPCKHRAGAKLVKNALALRDDAAQAEQAAELEALAAELVADAHAAGARWYGVAEGRAGAKMRLPELADFAAEWDAAALAARALVARPAFATVAA